MIHVTNPRWNGNDVEANNRSDEEGGDVNEIDNGDEERMIYENGENWKHV